jgi:secondary thiamine-phosphate synthase enzyme
MTKSSTVNTRENAVRPIAEGTSGLLVHADSITLQTDQRIQLVDFTAQVSDFVRASGVREGIVSLWSLHTTCALFINESQRALHSDIVRLLEQIIARDAQWLHNDPQHSDCDRMNADSHLRAMLLGHSLTLQISGSEVVLGQWQRVLVAELDGPRARTLRLQIMGIG